ncbi:MAG: Mur ligase family protein [Hyphomicrobiaceae bacterium]
MTNKEEKLPNALYRFIKSPEARSRRKARRRFQKRLFRRIFLLPVRRRKFRNHLVALITGTKGKTSTTNALAHILRESGHRVGVATTDGIVIGTQLIKADDSAGYTSTGRILNDPSVTAAVIETARGGIIDGGLYVDRCTVGALLNVGREQIGIDGIETVEQMASVKRQVVDAAQQRVILNADDPLCLKLADEYPAFKTTLYSLTADSKSLQQHLTRGARVVCVTEDPDSTIVVRENEHCLPILPTRKLAFAWGGRIRHNLSNALAATALADGIGIAHSVIARGLESFQNNSEVSQGRFAVVDDYPFRVIVDIADNPVAAEALCSSLKAIRHDGRIVCLLTAVGNRPDWHYSELAAPFSQLCDHFVCCDNPQYLRDRQPGEVGHLLCAALHARGVAEESIDVVRDYQSGLAALRNTVRPGDLVLILGFEERGNFPIMRRAFACFENASQIEPA